MTDSEFKEIYLNFRSNKTKNTANLRTAVQFDSPSLIDWRTKGAVSPIND